MVLGPRPYTVYKPNFNNFRNSNIVSNKKLYLYLLINDVVLFKPMLNSLCHVEHMNFFSWDPLKCKTD